MKRYIALLRGINISGKNNIAMSELKEGVTELGFNDVVTYLNSGNVIFCSDVDDKSVLSDKIKGMIKDRFDLDIPVFIILQEELKELLDNAADWWGDDDNEIYDNLIFVMPPLSCKDVCDEIGDPKAEYEKVHSCNGAIFWSFVRKDYRKTNWWSRTVSSNESDRITIRTANTVRKIVNK